MGKVIYLCHYGDGKNMRAVTPAAITMIQYVSGALTEIGANPLLVSAANAKTDIPKTNSTTENGCDIVYPTCYGTDGKNVVFRVIARYRHGKALYKELLNQVKDGDTLVVYHAICLMGVLKKLRKKRNFRLILQVCEVYADVWEGAKFRDKEIKWIDGADAYIFASPQFCKSINRQNKPFAIVQGTYKTEKQITEKFSEDEIKKGESPRTHIVYAGTLDPRKGGFITAKAASYLDENYRIHIIGFGTGSEVEKMKKLAEELSQKSRCKVSYDGCFMGGEYIKFLQKCDIGLSAQDPDMPLNSTSFPSKVHSYMSNGLRVVSIKIPSITESTVGDNLYYYENQTESDIASAIKAVDFNDGYDGREIINRLDTELKARLKEMIFNGERR